VASIFLDFALLVDIVVVMWLTTYTLLTYSATIISLLHNIPSVVL